LLWAGKWIATSTSVTEKSRQQRLRESCSIQIGGEASQQGCRGGRFCWKRPLKNPAMTGETLPNLGIVRRRRPCRRKRIFHAYRGAEKKLTARRKETAKAVKNAAKKALQKKKKG